MQLSPKVYTFLVAVFASFGSILFGYDLGIIASVIPSADFARVMGPRYQDGNQLGLITSLLTLGAFFGQPTSGFLADRYGRRKAIIFGCIVFIFGGSLQTGARNINMMMAGRFFAGWGIGNLAMLAPLYQSEIAQPSIRGTLTALQQFMLGIGAFVASWVYAAYFAFRKMLIIIPHRGYANNKFHNNTGLGWRLSLGIQIVPAIPLLLCIMLFPESPRWLAMVGRDEEAKATLAKLHAHGDLNDPMINFEYQDIQTAIREETPDANPLKELFTKAYYFRPLLIGIIVQFSVQMTGVSAIQYYSTDLFKAVGFSADRTLYFQAYNSLVALGCEAICILTIDRVGRRWPLIACNVLSSICFAIESAIIVNYPASSTNDSAHYAFIAMTFVYNGVFSYGIGPLSWIIPVEILPNHLRATGTTITTMASWISNFMIGQITPKAFAAIGWRYYLVFCIFSMTNAITFFFILPESKGRRLEEMHEYFQTTSWIVPGHAPPAVAGRDVEKQMRQGVLTPGHVGEESAKREMEQIDGDTKTQF